MREAGATREAQRRHLAIAALVALVVLSAALVLAERNRAVSLARAEARDWEVVNRLVVAFHIELEGLTDDLLLAASAPEPTSPPAGRPGVASAYLPAGSRPADGPLSEGDLGRPEVIALLGRATDSGTLASSTPIDLDAGLRAVFAAPVYERLGPALGVQARRDVHRGWVVSTADLGAMLEPHLPEGAGARISVGSRSFAVGPGEPAAGVGHAVDLHGYLVDVRAGAVDRAGVALATWAIVGAGALLAAAAAAGTTSLLRRNRAQRAALERGEVQARVVAEVAPIVQHSLDLADVLPAIAVQLTDHFELAGIRLAVSGSAGGEVEVFGLGGRAGTPPAPVLTPPARLAAGEAVVLALQRGGRSVARLELVAGRDLTAEELRSLRVLTELITAAVVNANLYASQQDAVRRLRELDALKTVFLSTASHELRTPATAISGFASLLEQRWDDFPEERRNEVVARIAANARSLSAVVEDLLDFSLIDRGDAPLRTVPVDLAQLAGSVVDRLATFLVDHTIVVDVSPLPEVAGDHSALERVVTNLLTNAVKFSPTGTTITVSVREADGGGRLTVSDEGPGVPPEERSRIFTRFYRGEGEEVLHTRGVGIGLSVVRELVERLGGSVEVDDAPGGGARFTVWLPAAGARRGAEVAVGDDEEERDARAH